MSLWLIFLSIMVLPYVMFFTARAIHQDASIAPSARGWLAAGACLLFPVVVPVYWARRLRRGTRTA
jgi:hypothetical protein